jgi:hypothetical protein
MAPMMAAFERSDSPPEEWDRAETGRYLSRGTNRGWTTATIRGAVADDKVRGRPTG